jgi:hypothetical protein
MLPNDLIIGGGMGPGEADSKILIGAGAIRLQDRSSTARASL